MFVLGWFGVFLFAWWGLLNWLVCLVILYFGCCSGVFDGLFVWSLDLFGLFGICVLLVTLGLL